MSSESENGVHGYDNTVLEMAGFFMGRGPAFKQKYTIPPFNNVDYYNLFCSILKMRPAANNGSYSNIVSMLTSKRIIIEDDDNAMVSFLAVLGRFYHKTKKCMFRTAQQNYWLRSQKTKSKYGIAKFIWTRLKNIFRLVSKTCEYFQTLDHKMIESEDLKIEIPEDNLFIEVEESELEPPLPFRKNYLFQVETEQLEPFVSNPAVEKCLQKDFETESEDILELEPDIGDDIRDECLNEAESDDSLELERFIDDDANDECYYEHYIKYINETSSDYYNAHIFEYKRVVGPENLDVVKENVEEEGKRFRNKNNSCIVYIFSTNANASSLFNVLLSN